MNNWKYVVDSSAIIRRSKYQCYDKDAFKNHWRNFDQMIQDGIIVSTIQVELEIQAKNFEALQWAEDNNVMFQSLTSLATDEYNQLAIDFDEWFNGPQSKFPWADPEIIAFAKAHDLVVVTMEKWNCKTEIQNHRIPTICQKLGAYVHIRDEHSKNVDINTPFQCIDLLEFFKREGMYL